MRIKISDIGSFIVVVLVVCAFWLFLFQGIMAESDRRDGQKSSRKWMQERALNQWQTENKPELMKAMRQAAEGK